MQDKRRRQSQLQQEFHTKPEALQPMLSRDITQVAQDKRAACRAAADEPAAACYSDESKHGQKMQGQKIATAITQRPSASMKGVNLPPHFASIAARFSTAHFSNAAWPSAKRQFTTPSNHVPPMKHKIAKSHKTKLQKPAQWIKIRFHVGCAQYQSSFFFARRRKQLVGAGGRSMSSLVSLGVSTSTDCVVTSSAIGQVLHFRALRAHPMASAMEKV